MTIPRRSTKALTLGASALALLIPVAASAKDQPVKSPGDAVLHGIGPAPLKPDRILKPRRGLEPLWGKIRTFWGDATPFWGNIRTFWGDKGPFEDNLVPFWGNIRTFNDGSNASSVAPAWGNIRTFSGSLGARWGNIRTFSDKFDVGTQTADDAQQLGDELQGMVADSAATWGDAVLAQTGKSFTDGFAQSILGKYGVDPSRPETLAALDRGTREQFFMDWYDGLMNFSGADHVDHWMKEVNWTPALTQTLGEGADTKIGLLDFKVTGDEARNVSVWSGVSEVANGHGTAVASLMVAAHDGKGVMGIAPKATVIAYNPFDATNTAGWPDIRDGIVMLLKNGASVVNMSLGVPNWTMNPDWNGVFIDPAVRAFKTKSVFVMAAGNDGFVQTQNITWNKDNPAFIVVGSVDPNGNISSFSNTPGNTCLLDGTKCAGDYLKNHFIVAPGEMMLVSDGKGGVMRLSGTSFAAPLVSGTIALIHDRWPWYVNYPDDTVGIILRSAKDLGAPGVDPIYGYGELDVQAALSPLDFNKLQYKMAIDGKIVSYDVKGLRATTAAQRATWEPKSAYISAFEKTGGTQRDFQIPLSSKLANQTVSVNGSAEQFMGYLTDRFSTWLGAPTKFAGTTPSLGFGNTGAITTAVPGFGDATASLTMAPRTTRLGFRGSDVPFQSVLRVVTGDARFSFETGQGNAAASLAPVAGFGLTSDYDVQNGGANPFVGFASGGAYARMDAEIAPGLRVSAGATQRELRRDLGGMPLEARAALGIYSPYRAGAATASADYRFSGRAGVTMTYTVLHEAEALLGMQSRDAGDLPQGSTTDAMTIASDWQAPGGLSLAISGTIGRTRAGDTTRSAIAVGDQGLVSSAWQVVAGKEHLFDRADRLRLSLAQPMHVERGSIAVSDVAVIDRQTGEIGIVTRQSAVGGGQRRFVAEAIYGRDVGTAQLSLFGRANMAGETDPDTAAIVGGASIRLAW